MAYTPRKQDQYQRLVGMTAPQGAAAPTKRVGTEAPVGAADKSKPVEQFTQSAQQSPGGVFKRQLAGADISGISDLAAQPLRREAAAETERIRQEAEDYRRRQAEERGKLAQFDYSEPNRTEPTSTMGKFISRGPKISKTDQLMNAIMAGGPEAEQARLILTQQAAEAPELNIGDVREFSPLQALRGGSVEGLLRQEAKGPYSTGMAGLDALLFAKKGGGSQLAAEGLGLRTGTQAMADALEKSARSEESAKTKGLVEKQRTDLMGKLSERQAKELEKLKGPQAEMQAKRERQRTEAIAKTQREAIGQAMYELERTYPDMTPQERQSVMNALTQSEGNKAVEKMFSKPQVSLADVASPEQAAQYQNLLNLMGVGGRDVKELGLGQKGAGGRIKGMTRDELAQSSGNLDLMNQYRNAAIGAIQGERSKRAATQQQIMRESPEQFGRQSDSPFAGERRTTGAQQTFKEEDLPRRGRYA